MKDDSLEHRERIAAEAEFHNRRLAEEEGRSQDHYYGAINHLQSIVGLNQCTRNNQEETSNLRGFLRVRVPLVVNDNPSLVIVVHPALDGAATFMRKRFTDVINADVSRNGV